MTTLKNRLHLIALLTLAFALAVPLQPASAGTYRVPKGKPVFVVDLPDDWTCELDKDGDYKCEPKDQSAGFYSFQVISMPKLHSKAELKVQLPAVIRKIAESGIKDLAVGEIEDTKNGNGVPFTGLRADGKDKENDKACVLVIHAFEPQKGKWYALLVIGHTKAYDAHSEDYDSVTASIQTLQ